MHDRESYTQREKGIERNTVCLGWGVLKKRAREREAQANDHTQRKKNTDGERKG